VRVDSLDVATVAVVGFVSAVALWLVMGRRWLSDGRALTVLVALLGVAGLLQVVEPVLSAAASSAGPDSGPTTTVEAAPATSAAPVEQSTTPEPTEQSPPPSAPPRDRTEEFLRLVSDDQYTPPQQFAQYVVAGPTARGMFPCGPDDHKVAWTYAVGGGYLRFKATPKLTGAPSTSIRYAVTYTVYADGQPQTSPPLTGLDASAPQIDVPLTGVQSLRLEASVEVSADRPQDRNKCQSLVANWTDIAVT
jgi:hypothetical protein